MLVLAKNTNYRATGSWLTVTGLVICLFAIGFFKSTGPNYSFLPFFAISTSAIASASVGAKRGAIFLVAIFIYLVMWNIL